MDWGDLAKTIGKIGLPLLGTAVGGPAGGAVGGMIASALGLTEEAAPDQIEKAISTDPQAALKLRELEERNKSDLERLILQAEITSIEQVNATYQKEIASGDAFVRRMRPMFGYVLMLTVLIEALIAVYVSVAAPLFLPDLATVYQALSIPQSVALGVLGVYVKKRSDEKMAGNPAGLRAGGGMLDSLLGRVKA